MKSKYCQLRFKKEIDSTKELSEIVGKDEPVEKLAKKFLKRLDGFGHKHFKKIRVTEKIDRELEEMYSKKAELKNKTDIESKKDLEQIEEEMAIKYSEEMYQKIKSELK